MPRRIKDLLKPTIGSDPEMMILDLAQDKIVSSIPILKCNKHYPIDLKDGIKCYADNVLFEVSFKPAKTKDELIKRLGTVFARIQDRLGPRYRIQAQASHVYDAEELAQTFRPPGLPPDSSPELTCDPNVFGCEPSYDAWEERCNVPPESPDGLRTGSFHLHFGHEKLKDFQNRVNAVKLLDIFVGVSSVLFDRDETAANRRRMYGKSSEHRRPPHGLEFRVLGPYALRSPKLVDLVLDLADYALEPMRKGNDLEVINSVRPSKIQHAINTCDKELAEKILGAVGLPAHLLKRVKEDHGQIDMYKEWKLA